MSSTTHLGWFHIPLMHTPAQPPWVSRVERTMSRAADWLTAEDPTVHEVEGRRYYYLDQARMGREMDRL